MRYLNARQTGAAARARAREKKVRDSACGNVSHERMVSEGAFESTKTRRGCFGVKLPLARRADDARFLSSSITDPQDVTERVTQGSDRVPGERSYLPVPSSYVCRINVASRKRFVKMPILRTSQGMFKTHLQSISKEYMSVASIKISIQRYAVVDNKLLAMKRTARIIARAILYRVYAVKARKSSFENAIEYHLSLACEPEHV